MSTNKKYADNKNLDSGDPLLNKNIYSNVGPSGSGNGSNNNANHSNSNGNSTNNSNTTPNGVPSSESNNLKQTKSEFEYATLERTIAKLKTYLFAMFAVSVAGFIIVIIIVTVLYVNLNYDLTHHKHTPKVSELIGRILDKEELCIPCRTLTLGPSRKEAAELNQFTRKEVSPNNFDCCVETPQQLVEMLKMFIEKRFRQEAAKGFPDAYKSKDGTIKVRPSSNHSNHSSLPVANVQIMAQDRDYAEEAGKQYTVDQWNHDKDLAFTANGVRYRAGRLVVPQDGYYYVYSHVSFLEMDVANNAHNSLSHYLYRWNEAYKDQEKLAQNSITKCATPTTSAKQAGEYFSSLGAVFKLRAQDEVYVKVSNLTIMNTDSKQGHFGLYQITKTHSVIRMNTTKS